MLTPLLILLLVVVTIVASGASVCYRASEKRNNTLQERNRTLEERNESLDRQNQLMEHQYNLFATKPVITYLSEEQLSNLTRLVTATIITIAKQTN